MIKQISSYIILGLVLVIGSINLLLMPYHYVNHPNVLGTYYKPLIPLIESSAKAFLEEAKSIHDLDSAFNRGLMMDSSITAIDSVTIQPLIK
jgi:hypothetical protein